VRLVILGGTGSGKGTQLERLCKRMQIVGISTGEILRQKIANNTPLGFQAKPYVEKGELVPDQLMIQFIRQRLLQSDVTQGWLLDGYPRTAFQGEELDFLLDELQQKLNWAIYLQVSESVMKERSMVRSLVDDQPQIIERRIQMFQDITLHLLEYYDARHRLLTINGEQSPDLVEQEILRKLNYTQ
jgi:adenylate kinase